MINRALVSLGRFLIAVIFLVTAFRNLTSFGGMVQGMAGKGIPYTPVLAVLSIALEALGGLMLATGFQPRAGALLLIVFLVPVTILFHPVSDPTQLIQFLKNLAILGGLCVVVATADGKRGA